MRAYSLDVGDELLIDGRYRLTVIASAGGELLFALSEAAPEGGCEKLGELEEFCGEVRVRRCAAG